MMMMMMMMVAEICGVRCFASRARRPRGEEQSLPLEKLVGSEPSSRLVIPHISLMIRPPLTPTQAGVRKWVQTNNRTSPTLQDLRVLH
eukprot:5122951-Amphidinium_carterae.1